MALADYTAYVNGLSNPISNRRYKPLSATATALGPWLSTWKLAPDAGANPTTADNTLGPTTTGALFAAIAASGTPRLAQVEGSMGIPGVILLCDRLAHVGGFSGVVTTAQTASVGPSTTRATTGAGVLAAVEIYTQIGATATTVTASYTNQAGTASRTTPAIAIGANNSRENGRFLPFPLQAGDTGFKSVETVTLAATTGTAGNFGVTLYRPLAMFGSGTRGFNFLWDAVHGGGLNMPDVSGVCPFLLYFYSGATSGECVLDLRFLDT